MPSSMRAIMMCSTTSRGVKSLNGCAAREIKLRETTAEHTANKSMGPEGRVNRDRLRISKSKRDPAGGDPIRAGGTNRSEFAGTYCPDQASSADDAFAKLHGGWNAGIVRDCDGILSLDGSRAGVRTRTAFARGTACIGDADGRIT